MKKKRKKREIKNSFIQKKIFQLISKEITCNKFNCLYT